MPRPKSGVETKMRVAIFSDLHAVLPAWESFLKSTRAQGVEAYWCLGDVVGYGPQPIETLRAIRDLIEANRVNRYILGNHDAIAAGLMRTGQIAGTEMTRSGVNVDAENLTLSHQFQLKQNALDLLDWLSAKRDSQANPHLGVYLAHGAYIDPAKHATGNHGHSGRWEYATKTPLNAATQAREINQWHGDRALRLALYGHYHVPSLSRAHLQKMSAENVDFPWNEWITLDNLADSPALINVGSLALPRKQADDPRQAHSSYVLLDFDPSSDAPPEDIRVQFCTNPYDWRALVKDKRLFHDLYIMPDEVLRQIMNSSLPAGIPNPQS